MNDDPPAPSWPQFAIGAAVLGVAAVLAYGAAAIPSDAGYAGVGPDFLPWVVSVALAACGLWLMLEARRGGFRDLDPPSGAAQGDWGALAWVASGIVVNALLIERIGFVLACALCYALAVRGLRSAEGRPAGGPRRTAADAATGIAIAAPVFWLFTKVLSVSLPGLTGTGWL
ncbi:MAG: tripartite tricarboxylate transporter TctB family protein [Rubrivivax sp.]|jgi:putative tricarboxylic transport membrane protein|nr:tripartite tricarboxylate transporter TctB family protein [Rubrivivax sp.]